MSITSNSGNRNRVFLTAYDNEELVGKLLSDDADWLSLPKMVPRQNLGIFCDGPNCESQDPRLRCSSCLVAWYCSPDCQKKDWKMHKRTCKLYRERRFEKEAPSITSEGEYMYPKQFGSIIDSSGRIMDLEFDPQTKPLNEECQICMGSSYHADRSVILPCRHQFCAKCIMEWQKGNLVKRGGIQEGDKCPTFRERMPCVEESLLKRADDLYLQAKDMDDKHTQDIQQKHQQMCQTALELFNKVLLYKDCQRYTAMFKAALLTEMGRFQEAVDEIDKLIAYHYSITENPVALNCAKYEQALKEDNKDRQKELMNTMTRQLSTLNPNDGSPFIMINEAYTVQARAYMAGKEWEKAHQVTQEKLMDFTWRLQADTPWIFNDPGRLGNSLRKKNLEYMLNMGICEFQLGRYEEAIGALSCSVLMNRQCKLVLDSYRYLAWTFQALHDWEEVLKVVTMAALYQPHCQIVGEDVCIFYKETLKDWYDNHRQDEMPTYQTRKMDLLAK